MKKESTIVNTFMIHFIELMYEKMKKKFHINPEIEEAISNAKVEFPLSKIRNYSTMRNRLTRLSKEIHIDDLSTLTETFIEKYPDDSVKSIHNKIKAEYDLTTTETDLEKEIEEASRIMIGK